MASEVEKPSLVKWDIGQIFEHNEYESPKFDFVKSLGPRFQACFQYSYHSGAYTATWSLTASAFYSPLQLQVKAWLQDSSSPIPLLPKTSSQKKLIPIASSQRLFLQEDWSETYNFTPPKKTITIKTPLSTRPSNTSYTLYVEIRRLVEKFDGDDLQWNLMSEMANSFDNPNYSDAEVNVSNLRIFKVHKIVLCTQSDVFAAMFEHEFKEKNSKVVLINNADVEVVEGMLRYLYIGKIENIDELASRLLVLADQYQVKGLIALCMKALGKNITTDNIIERLELLDYSERLTAFKEPLFEFAKKNFDLISMLPEWSAFYQNHMDIVTQLMFYFAF